MLFNSLHFLVFFPLVCIAFFLLPHRFRWVLLLAASYYFYMCWNAIYLVLIVISTLIGYFSGIGIARAQSGGSRKAWLISSLVLNLGILFFFKYFNFFNQSLDGLFTSWGWSYSVPRFNVLLPVGISFYTFQILSYSVDVYRGRQATEKHPGIFALYVSFFPQLVAGPIERSTNLLPQFFEKVDFDEKRISSGLRMMLWGLFKKVVVADHLAYYVDRVYSQPEQAGGLDLLLATYLFGFQIYCDFSGYTDIAIGAARVMGFRLMENFRMPYFSKSIPEFWSRWHISLSTWFRDYVFIPLGGSRVGPAQWSRNIAIVFLVSGLWHGANWTFVFWGMLHALLYLGSRYTQTLRDRGAAIAGISRVPALRGILAVLITFQLVSFTWIFFRAASLEQAILVVQGIFSAGFGQAVLFHESLEILMPGLAGLAVLLGFEIHQVTGAPLLSMFHRKVWFRRTCYAVLCLMALNLRVQFQAPFIYFQF